MRGKITSIVVATDLSERSDRALVRAFRIAQAHDAKVSVVSVVDDALPRSVGSGVEERIREHLGQLVRARGIEAGIRVEAGDIVETLARHLNGEDCDLAVLGLHRPRAYMDMIRQTTMERVVQAARKPVLLVRDLCTRPYERILLPVSFSKACAAAAAAARTLSPDGALHLFHAWLVPFGGLTGGETSAMARQVRREVADEAAAWQATLPEGIPEPDLLHGTLGEVFSRKLGMLSPDLVAIGAHTRASVSLHRIGSFAAELIRDPPCDLLIARAAQA